MKQLICEMCGGTDLVKTDGVFICQHCGCKYSLEEAKKMMIEGKVDVSGSSVQIDHSKELDNLYEVARRAKESADADTAIKAYDEILIKDPKSWEAQFYSAYFRASKTNIAGIENAAYLLRNTALSSIELIKDIDDETERFVAILKIRNSLVNILSSMYHAAGLHYIKFKEVSSSGLELSARDKALKQMIIDVGDAIEQLDNEFPSQRKATEETSELALNGFVQYAGIAASMYKQLIKWMENDSIRLYTYSKELIKQLTEKIKVFDPSYEPPKNGGCYIATCVYGSYDCPQVWTLRRYRDYTLAETWYGRAFISVYYAISPTLVKWFGHTEWFKRMWRGSLDKMTKSLQAQGYESTPYKDKF